MLDDEFVDDECVHAGVRVARSLAAIEDPEQRRQRMVEHQRIAEAGAKDADGAAEPFPVEPADVADPEPRQWLIPGWLPRGRLASIYGRGAIGKSRLLLQIAHAVACAGPVAAWDPEVRDAYAVRGDVPSVPEPGRVLLVTWEDEADEHRRRWRMAHAAGAVTTPRIPAEIGIVDMRRHGAGALWAPDARGSGHTSTRGTWTKDAGARVLAMLPDYDLVTLDPLAAVYACSENDRALVRAFASALDAAAEDAHCAVILSAHPSRSGEADAGAESGSTDWRNAVRSRWVLARRNSGCETNTGDSVQGVCLELDKASYASAAGRIWLRSYYERAENGDWDRMAWLATTPFQAARAVHVADGGEAGDVRKVGDDGDPRTTVA